MPYADEYEEEKSFLDHRKSKVHRHPLYKQSRFLSPWTLTIISWLITSYFTLKTPSPTSCNCTNTATQTVNPLVDPPRRDSPDWSSDLESLQSAISYEKRVFTGALTYDKENDRVIPIPNPNPDEPAYVGPPSDAIDAAWHSLLHGQYTILTEEEAAPFTPALTTDPKDDLFHFQPDVFHSLHCLNLIRMRLDSDHYAHPGSHLQNLTEYFPQPGINRLHDDHCLDQIRQALMCHADLSPTPIYIWEGFPIRFSRGSNHTCRKWEPIREWLDQRNRDWGNIDISSR